MTGIFKVKLTIPNAPEPRRSQLVEAANLAEACLAMAALVPKDFEHGAVYISYVGELDGAATTAAPHIRGEP